MKLHRAVQWVRRNTCPRTTPCRCAPQSVASPYRAAAVVDREPETHFVPVRSGRFETLLSTEFTKEAFGDYVIGAVLGVAVTALIVMFTGAVTSVITHWRQ